MKIENIDFSALNYVDIVVFVIIGLSMLFAFIRGFVGSVLSLGGWILSIILTYQVFPYIKPYVASHVKSEFLVIMVGYAGLLLFLLISFAIFNAVFSTMMIAIKGSIPDIVLGGAFGFFRGALIVSFFSLCTSISINLINGNAPNSEKDDILPDAIKQAQTYPFLKQWRSILVKFMPVSLEQSLQFIADSLTDNSFDERFISSSIRKLYQYVDEEDLKSKDLPKNSDTDSLEEEIEMETLALLLSKYKEKLAKGQITGEELSQEDIKRLEELLLKKAPNKPKNREQIYGNKSKTS